MVLPSPDPQFRKMLGWLFILMGLPLAIYITARIYEKWESASWPLVSAKVITSEIYRRAGREGIYWCLKINYGYSVDGKSFSSRGLSTSKIGNAGCARERVEAIDRLKKFSPGSAFAARYRPSNPAIAIVYVGALDVLDYLFPVISAAFLITGVLCLAGKKEET